MTTPLHSKIESVEAQLPRRTRGPIFAIKNGVMGLDFACGHFIPGAIKGEEGARVKDALAMISPCPKCWPLGANFHRAMVADAMLPAVNA